MFPINHHSETNSMSYNKYIKYIPQKTKNIALLSAQASAMTSEDPLVSSTTAGAAMSQCKCTGSLSQSKRVILY